MSDYISREDAVKALRTIKACVKLFEDSIEECAVALDTMAKAADVRPRWISVEERLPEEDGRYLVRYKRDIVLEFTEVHDDEVRIMKYFTDTGWRFPFLCNSELRKAEQQEVTHWMPLPEPPKGSG